MSLLAGRRLGRLDMGEISVHATGPGEMNVSASTGSTTVTAANEEVAHGLQINVDSLGVSRARTPA